MRWLLIGASTIAGEHMIGTLRRAGQEVAAVQSAGRERAEAFAARHAIAVAGTDLDAPFSANPNAALERLVSAALVQIGEKRASDTSASIKWEHEDA